MNDENEEAKESPGREASDISDLLVFSVLAGKYDGHERNCKYSEDFSTLDEAIDAYDMMSGCPWRYIQYSGRTIELLREDFEIFE